MTRTLVLGDPHGRCNALKQVLNLSKFNYEEDKLIVLGDVVDGGEDTKGVIDELLKIKNLVLVVGNHDLWALWWMKTGDKTPVWYNQGGRQTALSYGNNHLNIPKEHIDLLMKSVKYYEEDDCVFVHGGFKLGTHPKDNTLSFVTWDRNLLIEAHSKQIPLFKHIYVGHTTTEIFGNKPGVKDCMYPLTLNNLTMMDTGAGFTGKLSMMDLNTKEVFQSDIQKPFEGKEAGR